VFGHFRIFRDEMKATSSENARTSGKHECVQQTPNAAAQMIERLNFDRDGADWPNRSASSFVQAGGFRWHVQRCGAGPVALLLHGTGASTHSWAGLMPLLAERFTVVAPDLPGHAFTSMPDGSRMSLPGMARSVAELIGELSLSPVLVIGHSAGAAVGIRMCLDRRIAPSAVVGINAALLPFRGFAGQVFSPLAKLLVLNPLVPRIFAWSASDERAVARLLRSTGTEPDSKFLDLYARLFRNSGHVAGALAMMARWDLDSIERELARLEMPLLLVAGSADAAVPADDSFRAAKAARTSRVTVIRGAGHLLHEERPDETARIVASFFDEVANRASDQH
jgi:magnesium chelatase accessory protein